MPTAARAPAGSGLHRHAAADGQGRRDGVGIASNEGRTDRARLARRAVPRRGERDEPGRAGEVPPLPAKREFPRLGGTRTQKADVRVIAASNRTLRDAVERGTFREDLSYRLQVFDIQLPPLRDRADDIPLLAEHFVAEFADTMGVPPARLSDGAREALMAHSWPGNIRELRNELESAAILSDAGIIERRHLTLQAKTPAGGIAARSGLVGAAEDRGRAAPDGLEQIEDGTAARPHTDAVVSAAVAQRDLERRYHGLL